MTPATPERIPASEEWIRDDCGCFCDCPLTRDWTDGLCDRCHTHAEAAAAERAETERLRAELHAEQEYAGRLGETLLRLGHHPAGKHQSPSQYDAESALACSIESCLEALEAATPAPRHGPWCVQSGSGDSAEPMVHGDACEDGRGTPSEAATPAPTPEPRAVALAKAHAALVMWVNSTDEAYLALLDEIAPLVDPEIANGPLIEALPDRLTTP